VIGPGVGLLAADTNVVVAFGAGMLSFLSPCVLPLVPGYLSLMSGVSTSQLSVATRTDTKVILRSTLLFVLGFTLVFTALGAEASTLGSALQHHKRVLDQVSGSIIILMGLILAGAVSPRFVQQERRFHVSPSRLGVWAPPVMGMAFAFGWTPCIGVQLGAILSLAADSGTLTKGVVLLVFYSLGLGVPFVAAGLAFDQLTGAFAWVKRHFRVINLVSGLLLAAFGLVLLTNGIAAWSSHVSTWMHDMHLDRLTTS
jgi:cytochrome c-type biogenesis protein